MTREESRLYKPREHLLSFSFNILFTMIKYNKGSGNMIKEFTKMNTKKYKFDTKTKICILILIFFIGTIVGWVYEQIFYYIFENT